MIRKQARKTGLGLAAGGVFVLAGSLVAVPSMMPVYAADSPAQVIEDRQDNMKTIGKNMKVVVKFLKEGEGTAADVEQSARKIADLARHIPDWFPEGTSLDDIEKPETGAKPKIWEDWPKFEEAAKTMRAEALKLADVAAGGDVAAIGQQAGALGKNGCGGCHKPFREKLD